MKNRILNLVHRFRKVATFYFDDLTYHGHPDFGCLFAIHPATRDHDPFLVVKYPDNPEPTTYHYDYLADLYREFDYFQLSYSHWVTNSGRELTWEMMTSGPDQSTLR